MDVGSAKKKSPEGQGVEEAEKSKEAREKRERDRSSNGAFPGFGRGWASRGGKIKSIVLGINFFPSPPKFLLLDLGILHLFFHQFPG